MHSFNEIRHRLHCPPNVLSLLDMEVQTAMFHRALFANGIANLYKGATFPAFVVSAVIHGEAISYDGTFMATWIIYCR
jgi:hypothetical protein